MAFPILSTWASCLRSVTVKKEDDAQFLSGDTNQYSMIQLTIIIIIQCIALLVF